MEAQQATRLVCTRAEAFPQNEEEYRRDIKRYKSLFPENINSTVHENKNIVHMALKSLDDFLNKQKG